MMDVIPSSAPSSPVPALVPPASRSAPSGPKPAAHPAAAGPPDEFLPTAELSVIPKSASSGAVPAIAPPGAGHAAPRLGPPRNAGAPRVTRLEWTSGKPLSGRYVMIDKLGEGGMGTVYLADDLLLRRKVAVKTLWDEDLFETADIERLRKEVALAHSVSHPNVARTYDLGVAGGVHYITMEALRGETLMDRIKRGPLMTSAQVRDFALPLCMGLRAAHKAGVVHRDLKPANIMLVGGERKVAIMDFGIAAAVTDLIESPSVTRRPDGKAPNTWQVTSAGLGTPVYMAPEQWDQKTGDQRTDVYALGVILYVCLTGEAPYYADSNEQIGELHRSAEIPDLTKKIKGVDGDLAALIRACLAKRPEDRPGDMDAVIERLERPRRRRIYAKQLALGLVATTTLLSAIGVSLYAFAANVLVDEMRPSLRRLSELTARQLDIADLDQITKPGDIDSPAFGRVKAVMRRIEAENPDAHYIYVFRAGPDASRWSYVYDTYHLSQDLNHNGTIDKDTDEEGDPPGEPFDSRAFPAMAEARATGKSTADNDFSRDKWRISISGYTPVPVGKAQAPYLVGADVTSEPLVDLRRTLMLVLGIAELAAMAAMAFALSPTRQLQRALRRADEQSRSRED